MLTFRHSKSEYTARDADSFFFSSRRRHTRFDCDWSSDVCSSDLVVRQAQPETRQQVRRERVIDRRRLPARVTRLLRLLEVVGQGARVDAQEPDLACGMLGRVARRRLELGLEVL